MPTQTLWCRPPGAPSTRIELGCGLLRILQASIEAATERPPTGRLWLWDEALAAVTAQDGEVLVRLPAGVEQLPVRAGEPLKTLSQIEAILSTMARLDLDRGAELVAIGGGTVGDAGGLAASLFLRGIALVQVPTTLLAMIDSSVGGKTAVNLPEGKNLIGSVHPPRLVIADMNALATLPEAEFKSGLGEALKMAIGLDRELFEFMEQHRDAVLARDLDTLGDVVRRSILGKIEVVEGDLHEGGRRRVLNLGHTWGHALEIHERFTIPHGVAVARGLHVVLDLAANRGQLDRDDHARCATLLTNYGFDKTPIPDNATLAPYLRRDKKVRGDELHVVLPTGVGTCTVEPIPLGQITGA